MQEKYLNTKVPKGIFFYPCCGSDIINPILFFADIIKDFHFVDIRGMWEEVSFKEHFYEKYTEVEIPDPEKRTFKNQIEISQQCTQCEYGPRDQNCNVVMCPENPEYIQYKLEVDMKPCTKWIIPSDRRIKTDEDKKQILVTLHKTCAERLLQRFAEISIFHYRNDTDGEGGSNIHWLDPPLIDLILFKLKDGGLIVHDGSNVGKSEARFLVDERLISRNNQYYYHKRYFSYVDSIYKDKIWQVTTNPKPKLNIVEKTSDITKNESIFLSLL